MRSGIQPGKAPAQNLNPHLPSIQIVVVYVCYLDFTSCRRLKIAGHVEDAAVIEVDAGYGKVGAGILRFFFYAQCLARAVELHNSVSTGVGDRIGENKGAALQGSCFLEDFG